MFRLIRLVVFVGIAFVAGILYERFNAPEKCEIRGGKYIDGL